MLEHAGRLFSCMLAEDVSAALHTPDAWKPLPMHNPAFRPLSQHPLLHLRLLLPRYILHCPPPSGSMLRQVRRWHRAPGDTGDSSRGLTSDGRIKPDLVAPGTHIVSARARGTASGGGGLHRVKRGPSLGSP